jgi:hypothetical protein
MRFKSAAQRKAVMARVSQKNKSRSRYSAVVATDNASEPGYKPFQLESSNLAGIKHKIRHFDKRYGHLDGSMVSYEIYSPKGKFVKSRQKYAGQSGYEDEYNTE